MSLILDGTNGLSDVDGSAATPAIRGTDTNTGIFFPAADTIAFAEGGTEAMRIDSDGDVGIGTTSPATKLHVSTSGAGVQDVQWLNNSQAVGAGVGSRLVFTGTSSNNGLAAIDGAFAGATTADGGYMAFNTRAVTSGALTERMRIDSSGNLCVGTTTSSARFTLHSDGSSTMPMRVNNTAAGAGSVTVIGIQRNSSTTGTIANTDAVTSYNTTSDYRLKEDVSPMVGALDKVTQLKPVTYKWKSNGSDGQGFIAHELQTVVPDCVTGEKDAVDAEGKPVYQGIDTSFLVATLTAAIQELKATVDAQAARIAALENPPVESAPNE
jgi:hypothetical protein